MQQVRAIGEYKKKYRQFSQGKPLENIVPLLVAMFTSKDTQHTGIMDWHARLAAYYESSRAQGGPQNQGQGGQQNQGQGGQQQNQGQGGLQNPGQGGPQNRGQGGPQNRGQGGPQNRGQGGPQNRGQSGQQNRSQSGNQTQNGANMWHNIRAGAGQSSGASR